MQTVSMVDTIHATVVSKPDVVHGFAYVGGYSSGTSDIQWTAQDWAQTQGARRVRIWQGYGAFPEVGTYDEIDIESGAVTASMAAEAVQERVQAGITWTNLYGTLSSLQAAATAIQRSGQAVWLGHVTCRLADWDLDLAAATKLVGTFQAGMRCVGVQWASPSSNPNTVLPGGTGLTLREANCDLSVVDAGWVPSGNGGSVGAVIQGVRTLSEIVARYSDGSETTLLTM